VSAPQTLRLLSGAVEVRTLAAVPPVNIAKRPARSAGPALLRRDGVGSFQPGTLLGQLEVAGAREPSWEHPAAPLGASRAQKEHESPFPGWCWCPPPGFTKPAASSRAGWCLWSKSRMIFQSRQLF